MENVRLLRSMDDIIMRGGSSPQLFTAGNPIPYIVRAKMPLSKGSYYSTSFQLPADFFPGRLSLPFLLVAWTKGAWFTPSGQRRYEAHGLLARDQKAFHHKRHTLHSHAVTMEALMTYATCSYGGGRCTAQLQVMALRPCASSAR